jgi:hypothetical protein
MIRRSAGNDLTWRWPRLDGWATLDIDTPAFMIDNHVHFYEFEKWLRHLTICEMWLLISTLILFFHRQNRQKGTWLNNRTSLFSSKVFKVVDHHLISLATAAKEMFYVWIHAPTFVRTNFSWHAHFYITDICLNVLYKFLINTIFNF